MLSGCFLAKLSATQQATSFTSGLALLSKASFRKGSTYPPLQGAASSYISLINAAAAVATGFCLSAQASINLGTCEYKETLPFASALVKRDSNACRPSRASFLSPSLAMQSTADMLTCERSKWCYLT